MTTALVFIPKYSEERLKNSGNKKSFGSIVDPPDAASA